MSKDKFTCDCKSKGFDLIHTQKIEYYLCNCDKIYKLTSEDMNFGRGRELHQTWEFVNYDSCYYCGKPKDICTGPDDECQSVPLGEKR